ncbi:hypothetical protein PR048_009380 [Dryococelus australis]|uniref:Uncharacterized protein n=1 Tax=Dryococelus australis TaxID=614101 RepID=A0ABQ9HZT0_9NEOP|nr:hypothetical protein PR048_009380 [Dryococelus australis]
MSLPVPPYTLTGALSDMRAVKLVTRDGTPIIALEFTNAVIKSPASSHSSHFGGVSVSRCTGLVTSHQGDPGSIPGRVTPDFRMWESCRTMPLVSGFFRGSPVSPALSFRRCSILTSITLIAIHISSLTLGDNTRRLDGYELFSCCCGPGLVSEWLRRAPCGLILAWQACVCALIGLQAPAGAQHPGQTYTCHYGHYATTFLLYALIYSVVGRWSIQQSRRGIRARKHVPDTPPPTHPSQNTNHFPQTAGLATGRHEVPFACSPLHGRRLIDPIRICALVQCGIMCGLSRVRDTCSICSPTLGRTYSPARGSALDVIWQHFAGFVPARVGCEREAPAHALSNSDPRLLELCLILVLMAESCLQARLGSGGPPHAIRRSS